MFPRCFSLRKRHGVDSEFVWQWLYMTALAKMCPGLIQDKLRVGRYSNRDNMLIWHLAKQQNWVWDLCPLLGQELDDPPGGDQYSHLKRRSYSSRHAFFLH